VDQQRNDCLGWPWRFQHRREVLRAIRFADTHANTYCDPNRHSYSHTNAHAYWNTESYSNTKASPDAGSSSGTATLKRKLINNS